MNTNGDEDEELTLTVGESGRMLNINEKVDGKADALLKACARVNKENRSAVTMTATIRANLSLAAGSNIKIKDAYNLNGKYFIDKITHSIDAEGAYTMDLELHLVQKKIKTATTASSAKSTAAQTALAVGDKVIVNGNAYYAGNGGTYNVCNNMTMYITEIIGESYKYRYGVAKRSGGTRYGWCAESSLTKA